MISFKQSVQSLRWICSGCMVLGMIAGVQATDYYVSSGGSDGNPGTSSGTAWATISKVNGVDLNAGDKVYFQGGSAFSGTLTLDASDAGSSGNPVTVTSYGTGRATINGGNGNGITLSSTQYVTITNINAVGSGYSVNSGKGVDCNKSSDCIIDNMDVSGFGHSGVELYAPTSNVRVTYIYAHDNGYAGISGYPDGGRIQNVSNTNAYIGHCRAIRNTGNPRDGGHSGSGIVLLQGLNSTIEYCEASENGGTGTSSGGGPVGLWTCLSRNTTIQYCVSHDNKTGRTQTDGGGYDFDGATIGCTLQYSLSYDNVNASILLMSWGSSVQCSLNVVRYNVFENDPFNVRVFGGADQRNLQIYNNTMYTSNGPNIDCSFGAVPSIYFRNNILATSGGGYFFNGAKEATYQNNCYWDYDGGNTSWDTYSSLEAWRTATGHEKLNNNPVGIHANPLLTNPGSSGFTKITDPTQLRNLTPYLLQSSSPCINAGLDLKTLFNTNVGSKDYYGNTIPANGGFDIGAHEFTGTVQWGCAITNIAPGAKVGAGLPLTIIAGITPSSKNGSISKVEFYSGTTKLGEDANGTDGWSYVWSNPTAGAYQMSVKATDNASATSTSSSVSITVVALRTPENPSGAANGLDYKYWERSANAGCSMNEWSITSSPNKTGTVLNFDMSPRNSSVYFKFEYTGYIDAPTDGIYTFFVKSNFGTMAYIGTTTIISADGCHGNEEFIGMPIGLKAGKHAIRLVHYSPPTSPQLDISWEGGNVAKQLVPNNRLFHGGSGATIAGRTRVTKAICNDVRVVGNMLEVTTTLPGDNHVKMYNHQGKLVRSFALLGAHRSLVPVSYIVNGRYTVVIASKNGSFTKEITIVK